MEYVVMFLVVILLLVLILLKGFYDYKKNFKKMQEKFKAEYGKAPERSYTMDELEFIKDQFYRYRNDHCIDDITASDLSIDDVFKRINYSKSTPGDSYLYNLLRTPQDKMTLNTLSKKAEYFSQNEEQRIKLINYFYLIGRMGKVSFYDSIDCLEEIKGKSLLFDYCTILFVLAGIALIFVNPSVGIIILVSALVTNILTYYSARGTIEPYIVTFSYINRFINQAKEIKSLKLDIIEEECEIISKDVDGLRSFSKKAKLLTGSTNSSIGVGNPFEMLLDYAMMIFHIDIINFYKMLEIVKSEIDHIEDLYFTLGKIESYINISYYRKSLQFWCEPIESDKLELIDAYHPLINEPVSNSIDVNKSVLITGSNASGKSTFLKTVALNILFSETISTCLCSKYTGSSCSIFSSMSLRDDISGKDSYFMVEIKAMKRILDYTNKYPERKTVCFVDEVLRGTNTVERIAASTEILKYIVDNNCLCFAATHDGELTFLLEDIYDNYHFDEQIIKDDVLFSYKINFGRATSRNAIKLLDVMGFDKSITQSATKRAEYFIEKGIWI